MEIIIRILIFIVPVCLLGYWLSKYLYKIYQGEKNFLTKIIQPIEKCLYRLLKIETTEEMNGKQYFLSVIVFSLVCFLGLFLILLLQGILPLNPQKMQDLDVSLAFNTAISFMTNTNWQNYAGENTLSYFTQMLGLTVQNFISAGVGISVLFALIRGITRKQQKTIGNFWTDFIRIILYILIPLSILLSVGLLASHVVQTFEPYQRIQTIEGKTQTIPLGPVASQVAIKQLGSNGGGFFGTNSAYPLENPTVASNYLECISILLLPIALVFLFGKAVKNEKQSYCIFIAMLVVLILALIGVTFLENIAVNYEGKEVRFGIINSSIWSVFTTAVSNGSVNSMHDSYTALSGGIQIILMAIGEVVFGGVGSGLYTMIGFILITVFIAGLMVGRTPEYLGKKIEPYEMKMAMLLILTTPFCILITGLILCLLPNILGSLTNIGPHGFSQLFYAVTSTGANNGSSFTGFMGNAFWINIILGFNMLIARLVPMYATLKIADSLAQKKIIAQSAGTLKTTTTLFITLLVLIILIIGGLSFFPALALGPIAEII